MNWFDWIISEAKYKEFFGSSFDGDCYVVFSFDPWESFRSWVATWNAEYPNINLRVTINPSTQRYEVFFFNEDEDDGTSGDYKGHSKEFAGQISSYEDFCDRLTEAAKEAEEKWGLRERVGS